MHHLQVIGDAARGLSSSIRDRHPEVPWPQIIVLRNILVREYFGLDLRHVWIMTRRHLPALENQVQSIQSEIAPD